jgi:trans-aconitate 2-methyltransferase
MGEEPTHWDPEDYARHSGAQLAWAEELIGKLLLRGAERVLDIGSGDGKVTALLAGKVPRGWVVGIDSSADMVATARLRFPPNLHGNIRFLLMDAASMDLEDRFDIAFSSATLHWVKDQSAVLRGVRRCLEPAGRILFQMG